MICETAISREVSGIKSSGWTQNDERIWIDYLHRSDLKNIGNWGRNYRFNFPENFFEFLRRTTTRQKFFRNFEFFSKIFICLWVIVKNINYISQYSIFCDLFRKHVSFDMSTFVNLWLILIAFHSEKYINSLWQFMDAIFAQKITHIFIYLWKKFRGPNTNL